MSPDEGSEAEFRRAALAFLSAHASPRRLEETGWGQGSDRVGLFRESTPEEDLVELAEARAWRAQCFDAGFVWTAGPPAYGGGGRARSLDRVWAELESGYAVPTGANLFLVGLGMVAPTILAHGTEEAKQAYLRALWRADLIGCQLFSEPGAGSDLANVSTRATRDGDDWLVTGQKVWTSGAHYSDLGLLLARTSSGGESKHEGLTMFLVDMHSPGIDVRPLRQMTGGTSFNEVFLDNVRIPDWHRLGEVGEGWRVARTTLMNERAAIGGGSASSGFSTTRRLFDLARHTGAADDPVIRQQLAELHIRSEITRATRRRTAGRARAGHTPGPENSVGKVFLVETQSLMVELATAILGPRLVADSGEWGTYAWSEFVLGAPSGRIGGGTDEIQKNIIAERVLGLPRS
ncbi:MAG TPA: acyl-CoA dehydrogenase family protein [Sporichthya sp.]|nr:acyl-CoA dehydrogenase family protein [Sporichthya sp.]